MKHIEPFPVVNLPGDALRKALASNPHDYVQPSINPAPRPTNAPAKPVRPVSIKEREALALAQIKAIQSNPSTRI